MGSHSVICHPTEVTARFHPNRAGWYSIYRPRKDERPSWPSWLVTYRNGLPVHRRSPIRVLTGSDRSQRVTTKPNRQLNCSCSVSIMGKHHLISLTQWQQPQVSSHVPAWDRRPVTATSFRGHDFDLVNTDFPLLVRKHGTIDLHVCIRLDLQ